MEKEVDPVWSPRSTENRCRFNYLFLSAESNLSRRSIWSCLRLTPLFKASTATKLLLLFPTLYQQVDQAHFSFSYLKPPAGFFLPNLSLFSPWNAVPTTLSCIYKTAVYNSLLCKEKSNLQPKQLTIPIPLLSPLCYKKVILFNGGGGPIEKIGHISLERTPWLILTSDSRQNIWIHPAYN